MGKSSSQLALTHSKDTFLPLTWRRKKVHAEMT